MSRCTGTVVGFLCLCWCGLLFLGYGIGARLITLPYAEEAFTAFLYTSRAAKEVTHVECHLYYNPLNRTGFLLGVGEITHTCRGEFVSSILRNGSLALWVHCDAGTLSRQRCQPLS